MAFKKAVKFFGKNKLAILILAVVFGLVFFIGYSFGARQSSATKLPVASSTVNEISGDSNKLDADFSLFWDAIRVAKSKYVNIDEVTDKDFLYGAIRGAIDSMKDPYSVFLEPTDAKKFDEDVKGNFGGIGAEIGIKENEIIIIAPLKNNPAEKAGLKAGDKILKVGGKSTAGLTVDDAVKLIRGETGTIVNLLILRDSWKEAREIKVTRAIIIVPTLDWKMIKSSENGPEDIFYVQLYNFNANASSLFREAATEALFKGTRGIIFDLRDNPGGYLDVAIDLAGWFLDRGDVVTREKFYGGKKEPLVAQGNSVFRKIPVVLIVNGGSASASEILAGALHDTLGSKLIGTKTFGKGSVQELVNLKDGSTLKISTAEWLTPKGYSINKKGLEPDINVAVKEEGDKSKSDHFLEKALETLKPQLSPEPVLQTILINL